MLPFTEIALFVSSTLLALSGCFAVVATHYRKSNCTSIEGCGMKCTRENLDIDDS